MTLPVNVFINRQLYASIIELSVFICVCFNGKLSPVEAWAWGPDCSRWLAEDCNLITPSFIWLLRGEALVCTIIVAGWRERNLASNYVSICVHLQNFGCSFQLKYSSSHLLTTTGLSREWLHLAGTLLANWNSTSLNLNLVSNEIKRL